MNTAINPERRGFLDDADARRDRSARVQDFAGTVVFSPKWQLLGMCQVAATMLGCSSREAIGKPLEAVFPPQTAHRMRSRSQALTPQDPIMNIAGCPMTDQPEGVNVTAALTDECYVFSFEAPIPKSQPSFEIEHVQRLLARIARQDSVENAANEAVRALRAFLVVDRVSLHLVNNDEICPALAFAGGEPLRNAPSQALLSAVDRAHVAAPMAVPLLPASDHIVVSDGGRVPLDMMPNRPVPETLATELQDEGVRSVQVYPVYRDDRLWAVFLCHHSQPLLPHFLDRQIVAVFAGLLGHVFSVKLVAEDKVTSI